MENCVGWLFTMPITKRTAMMRSERNICRTAGAQAGRKRQHSVTDSDRDGKGGGEGRELLAARMIVVSPMKLEWEGNSDIYKKQLIITTFLKQEELHIDQTHALRHKFTRIHAKLEPFS